MAKPNEETKPTAVRVLEILKKEYPFEGTLLALLGIVVIVLGVYIFEGQVLQIRLTDWWIFNTPLKIQIFSVTVALIGAAALFYALMPFFVPSFKEMNRVSWPDRDTMYNHTARVFGFLIFLAVTFILYDFIFRPIFSFLYDLGV